MTVRASGAILSSDRMYRFALWRPVDSLVVPERRALLFVMHNPSTADADDDDPTIRRCIGYARAWGYSILFIANVNPYRATHPKDVREPSEHALMVNDIALRTLGEMADRVVCAWGLDAPLALTRRACEVLRKFRDLDVITFTKNGTPKHPLYCRADLGPMGWIQKIEEVLHAEEA